MSLVKIIKDKEGKEHYVLTETQTKAEKGYWVRIPEKWWRGVLKGLRPTERCLLISLKVWGAVRPSTNKMAQELGITWRTADKGLKSLRKKGLLPSAKKQK